MLTRIDRAWLSRCCRLLAMVMVSVVCLAGADCGGGGDPVDTSNPPLVGTDPTTAPPPSPQDTLISLINSQVRAGLTPVASDTAGTNVAQTHADYLFSTGNLTDIMNGQNFTTRMIAAGVAPPVNSTDVIASGFSDPQTLVNAILANSTITQNLQGNYTRIGVGISGQGNGNYWTILLY